MGAERTAIAEGIRAFCARHPQWILFDEPGNALFEVASGKRLPLPLTEVVSATERENAQTRRPYLLIGFGDGKEIALADVGVAFPPVVPNVPQTPELPGVVCLQDFRLVLDQLQHQALDHPEQKLQRATLDLMVFALAILEGARRIGFDVSEEERLLEQTLTELEKR